MAATMHLLRAAAATTRRTTATKALQRGLATTTSAAGGRKVAVLGAAGGIGQPLALLLKLSSNVGSLSLYDIQGTPGVAADLSHIDSVSRVEGYTGDEQLGTALKGSDVVVIPAGVPRKPGMTRDDLFNTNASIVQSLVRACATHCPEAHLAIISNPVNSTVPIAAETLRQAGVYDPRRLFGVTTLDVLRANTFVGEAVGADPNDLEVNVVGGHAGVTILPLLSQLEASIKQKLTEEQIAALTHRIQFGGDEVVKAKEGAGSATLSMAFAGARFTQSLLKALDGEQGVSECAFVESSVVADTPFFSSRVDLGREGVSNINPLGEMSDFEKEGLAKAVPELQASIEKGFKFAKGQ